VEPDTGSTLHAVEEAEHEGRPPAAGRTTDLVVGIAVVGLGVAALLGSLALGVGSARTPGPGTWPLLVSGVLVVLGGGLLATIGRTGDAERFTRATWLVLAGLATMAGFVAVVAVIGFEIPSALLMFVWLRFLGGEPWRTSIVTSIATVVGFYVVFVGLLAVPIPHMF
jgi:putative tricarboxylic transport membrane protein